MESTVPDYLIEDTVTSQTSGRNKQNKQGATKGKRKASLSPNKQFKSRQKGK